MTGILVRPEGAEDAVAVHALVTEAFGQPAEADLVEALRRGGDLVLALVAVEEGALVGHVAFSRLRPEALRWTALAPVAVRPDRQRRGIGTALIREGLSHLAASGEGGVLVLGEPATYRRFGFGTEAAAGLRTPYDGPYLQALVLAGAPPVPGTALAYAPAFAAL